MGCDPFSFLFLSLLLGFDGPGSAIGMSMVRHESEVQRGKEWASGRNLLGGWIESKRET